MCLTKSGESRKDCKGAFSSHTFAANGTSFSFLASRSISSTALPQTGSNGHHVNICHL